MKPNNLLLALFLGLFIGCSTSNEPAQVDILITGGSVFTGESDKLMQLELGISQNEIVYLGKQYKGEANRIISAEGLVVAPGFIDMHTHLDPLMNIPDAKSHLMQGSTTALGGPDGGGFWPFAENMDSIDQLDLGMNVAFLVGHNRIRNAVMGMDNRPPTDTELE